MQAPRTVRRRPRIPGVTGRGLARGTPAGRGGVAVRDDRAELDDRCTLFMEWLYTAAGPTAASIDAVPFGAEAGLDVYAVFRVIRECAARPGGRTLPDARPVAGSRHRRGGLSVRRARVAPPPGVDVG